MSYGHADKIAKIVADALAAGREKSGSPGPDPALYRREDVRRIVAARNIGALYRVLKDDAGMTQRRIAELTGQSQSEVSEILKGRQVRDVTVLERIAKGLGIPRELMGLSYGKDSAGIRLAKTAIGRMTTLNSPRSRMRLVPLAAALEAQRGSDARELARMARQVAAVRA